MRSARLAQIRGVGVAAGAVRILTVLIPELPAEAGRASMERKTT